MLDMELMLEILAIKTLFNKQLKYMQLYYLNKWRIYIEENFVMAKTYLTMLKLVYRTRAYLFSTDEMTCYVVSIENSCCEFCELFNFKVIIGKLLKFYRFLMDLHS